MQLNGTAETMQQQHDWEIVMMVDLMIGVHSYTVSLISKCRPGSLNIKAKEQTLYPVPLKASWVVFIFSRISWAIHTFSRVWLIEKLKRSHRATYWLNLYVFNNSEKHPDSLVENYYG